MFIYRSFSILQKPNGKWYVVAEDDTVLSSDLDSVEECQEFIDAHKRRGGK